MVINIGNVNYIVCKQHKIIIIKKGLLPFINFNVSFAIYGARESQITAIYLIHLTSLRRFKTFWGQIRVSAYHA